jgi:hypothetical protein
MLYLHESGVSALFRMTNLVSKLKWRRVWLEERCWPAASFYTIKCLFLDQSLGGGVETIQKNVD